MEDRDAAAIAEFAAHKDDVYFYRSILDVIIAFQMMNPEDQKRFDQLAIDSFREITKAWE